MNVTTFLKANISLESSHFVTEPEIPFVQDILFALRLSEKQIAFDAGLGSHSAYIVNACLTAASVAHEIVSMEFFDEGKARLIIARAIIALCPEEAKCFYKKGYVDAMQTLGQTVPGPLCVCANCLHAMDAEFIED